MFYMISLLVCYVIYFILGVKLNKSLSHYYYYLWAINAIFSGICEYINLKS